MEEFDVIVVGGGPAGSTCATFLGREGYKVLLLDKAKFPRDKTCGDAISGKSLSVLKELGLPAEVEKVMHAKVYGVTFSSPNSRVLKIPMKNPETSYGYVSPREVFDNVLFQNEKKYAKTMEQFQVTDLIKEGEKIVGIKGMDLVKKTPYEFRSKVVVGADGATSVVAQKLGLFEMDDEHHCVALRAYYEGVDGMDNTIELHFTENLIPGYFWIFPAGHDGYANVGLGMLTKDVKKRKINLKEVMFKEIEQNPLFKDRFKNAKLVSEVKGWNLPLASKMRKMAGDGWILIGDAASLIDPFSGEGIGNAMTSGKIGFRTISKALRLSNTSSQVLSEYEAELKKEIKDEVAMSYKLQQLGQHKFLLNLVIDKASRNKELQDQISGMLVNEEAKKGFMSPLFYLRLLFS